ncbi:MAG: tetratricopeptide repeat protein [Alphaproteobacteria bacterium]|nr:tetratricopeptide repeat protein [Alphaproteobacteria bacterium]
MLTTSGSRSGRCLGLLALLALTACAAADPPAESAGRDVKPLVVDLHRDHGWAAVHAERYEEATSYFQRILTDLPEDGRARLGLGEAYLGQGRLDDALAQFESLDDPAHAALEAKALQGQGIVLLRQGKRKKALGLLDQAVSMDEGLWRSWNALGRLRDADRDHAAARRAYRKAIALNPKAAFLHNNLGFSLLASGEPVYAEMSLDRALELDPRLAVAATNLRLALALQGRYGPALAGAGVEDRAVVLNNVGYAALLRGDHRKAKTLFLDAMAADPAFFREAKRNLAFLETIEADHSLKP